ncbi:MAG TPA: hypothetical protein VFS41_05090 [Edaphobacter sp.]|nr:hypothetical protein [Edaphobacter sp.]
MATSDVAICNLALLKIGHDDPISELTDETKAARLSRRFYEPMRDAVLRAHPWNFALGRANLAADPTTPAFEWAYAFTLPNDFLRLVQLWDTQIPFVIEGNQLLTNSETCKLKYVKKVTDPNRFDSIFIDVLATRIAINLAIPMAQDPELYERLTKSYRDALIEARFTDASEGKGPTYPDDTGWFEARGSE